MRPHTWSRAKPLLNVAGNTVIGHLLNHMSAITDQEVVFVVGAHGEAVQSWIHQRFPQLDAHFVIQKEPLGQAHALWLCRHFMDSEELLIAFGDGIVEADYVNIPDQEADVVCMVQQVEDPRTFGVAVVNEAGYVTQFIEKPESVEHKLAIAGIHWFRRGEILQNALQTVIREERMTKGEYYLTDAYDVLLENGTEVITKPVTFWVDAGKPNYMLEANAHLLSLGYGTDDAIDRSYAEDFTVVPPVFIHESATVYGSVIGPYANIEANVSIRNSVVRNSLVDAGSHVEDCVLDGALIGENCKIIGQSLAPFVGDNSVVEY
jgi:glucose-1-phosphate thymidylyltransferase